MAKKEPTIAGMNSLTVTGLNTYLDDMLWLDQPCLILGAAGIGKSDIVRQASERNGYQVLDRRVSQMLPEDFAGIPLGDLAKKTTERCIPDIVAEAWNLYNMNGQMPVNLFLDEVSNGTSQVHSALYEVALDRRSGNYEFPPNTRVTMAGNRAQDGGATIDLPRPLCNRLSIVEFSGPTYDEWSDWAIDNAVNPVILTALKVAPEFLHGKFSVEQDRNPTCRSWAAASLYLDRLDATGRADDRTGRMVGMSSYVGDEAALKIQSIYELSSKLQDPRLIMTVPDRVPASETLALAFLQTMQLSNLVSNVPETKNAFSWVERTCPELMAVLIRSCMRRHNAMLQAGGGKVSGGGIMSDAALINKVSSYGQQYMAAGANLRP